MKKIIFRILVVVLISYPCYASEYFVTTHNELESVIAQVQPGDTITMKNGVWVDEQIVFKGNGSENSPILLRAETPGMVALSGQSNMRISGTYLIVDGLLFINGYSPSGAVIEFRKESAGSAHYCRLTNSAIINYNPSSKSKDYKWVSIYGLHNRVDHCYFAGKDHSGAMLVIWFERTQNPPAHFHQIDHNYFGYRPPLGENGGETIRIGTSTYSMNNSNTVVEYNYFEHCNGEVEIISSKSCENIFQYNTFFECEGALVLRHGNRCIVRGNFFFGNKKEMTGGVRVIGENHRVYNNYFEGLYGTDFYAALSLMNGVPNSPLNRYFQVKNANIVFNTFVDCKQSILLGLGADAERTLPPLDCVIANNIVDSENQIITQLSDPINLKWEGNIMQGPSLGIQLPEGITLTDPKLVLAEDNLWRPDVDSPVLGAALGDYSFVVNDMDGQSRTEIWDVGADEVSSDPVVIRPLTSKDAGPDWIAKIDSVVRLAVSVNGNGSVVLDPPGGIYDKGTTVRITAVPDEGRNFIGWSGDLSGTENPIDVVLDHDLMITASFSEPKAYHLSVWINGSGSVTFEPPGGNYDYGEVVKLTAIPDAGWIFDSWANALSGNSNPDSVFMDSDKLVIANFKQASSLSEKNQREKFTYKLNQNYPNPFNSSTVLSFSLPTSGLVTLEIFDITGEKVVDLVKEKLSAGEHKFTFDLSFLKSGVYFYKLTSGKFVETKKLTLLK